MLDAYVERIAGDVKLARPMRIAVDCGNGVAGMLVPRLYRRLGCELTEEGYIKVDPTQKTSVPGILACGDNATRMRTVANAVSMGTAAGIMASRELVFEGF